MSARLALGAALAALVVSACGGPSVSRVRGPDGAPAYQIECVHDYGPCESASEKLCPQGYEVITLSNNGWPNGSGAYEGTMVVRCRGNAPPPKRDSAPSVSDAGAGASRKRRHK